jgi:site-specific DNA recombinase
LTKQDSDYYSGILSSTVYSRLSDTLSLQVNVIEALGRFEELYSDASNEEKRALMRSLIKEIHMDSDRKAIKNIVFWFTENDVSNASDALPTTEMGRTVSQVTAKIMLWENKITVERQLTETVTIL